MPANFADYAAARWSALVRAAVLMGASVEEAQDLAQTTLIHTYAAWRRVRSARDPDAYVHKILVNNHRAARRRRWAGEVPTEHARLDPIMPLDSEDPATAYDDVEAVARALAGLSPAHREVVVLRYYLDHTEAQIAAIVGTAPGTVKSRLARGLRALAQDPDLARTFGRRAT